MVFVLRLDEATEVLESNDLPGNSSSHRSQCAAAVSEQQTAAEQVVAEEQAAAAESEQAEAADPGRLLDGCELFGPEVQTLSQSVTCSVA